MGNLCSPNIAAQVDLFLCVLPACLVEHSCLSLLVMWFYIYADICVKYLELFLLHHEYRVSGEAHEARKCLHQCHRTCYFCSWHCYRAQGKVMLFHFFFSLCLGIVLNMMAAAQRIATEVASTRAAAVATSTGNDAPAQQVFCLLASRFCLLTSEPTCRTLCSGQVRRFPRDEAITFLLEGSPYLEAPLPIREMITGVTVMTEGNFHGWVHIDVKRKQRAKVHVLQIHIAEANTRTLEFFFNSWVTCKRFF